MSSSSSVAGRLRCGAAHLVAQVGRLDRDRLYRLDGSLGRHQPAQPARAAEAPFQKLRSLERADGRGGSAENDGNQAFAVARGGGNEIESGGTDESGLHPVRAGIAAKERVVVPLHHLSHADARQVPVVVILRELADERACENGEVARGGNLIVRRQAVGIHKARLRHAEMAGMPVHQIGKALDRAAHTFGQHDGDIVRRLDHHHLEGIVDRDLRAGAEAHLHRGLRHRVGRDGQRLVEGNPAVLHGMQGHVGSHQLGDRSRIPGVPRILGVQHLAGVGLDDEQRFGGRPRPRQSHCGTQQGRPHQSSCTAERGQSLHVSGSVG